MLHLTLLISKPHLWKTVACSPKTFARQCSAEGYVQKGVQADAFVLQTSAESSLQTVRGQSVLALQGMQYLSLYQVSSQKRTKEQLQYLSWVHHDRYLLQVTMSNYPVPRVCSDPCDKPCSAWWHAHPCMTSFLCVASTGTCLLLRSCDASQFLARSCLLPQPELRPSTYFS